MGHGGVECLKDAMSWPKKEAGTLAQERSNSASALSELGMHTIASRIWRAISRVRVSGHVSATSRRTFLYSVSLDEVFILPLYRCFGVSTLVPRARHAAYQGWA